jgi:hypothetical protein
MPGTTMLNCMVLGESPDLAFVIEADPTKSADHLKILIKERRPDVFGDVVSVLISLWKVKIRLDTPNKKLSVLTEDPSACIETKLDGSRMRPLQKIRELFPSDRVGETVDIIVEPPVDVKTPNLTATAPIPPKRPLPLEFDDQGDEQSSSLAAAPSTPSVKMPRRTPLEDRVKTYVESNGVDHYYKIGRKAKTASTMSHMTIAERDRVERMFVRYQEMRGVSVTWPRKGPTIKDCAAFMGVLADAGQGLLDERITKRYFLKLVRNFGVLVSSFFFSFPFYSCRTRE